MGEEAVEDDEVERGEEERCRVAASGGVGESDGDTEAVGQGVQEEAGEGGVKVVIHGGDAPGGCVSGDEVEFKGGEFGPERVLLPEEAIDWDGQEEGDDCGGEAGRENLLPDVDLVGEE